jgi:membrane associated rhomboid family serine protease
MTFGPVGIRCPDHAGAAARTVAAAPKQVARKASRSLDRYGPYVTFALIGINVGVYLLELASGAPMNGQGGRIWAEGVLFGPLVADGEWWRLITAAFLHYGPLHLGLNMLVLWFIGPALEDYFGHARYLLLYIVGGLAGSAGALIVSPNALTVGASGAIFGLMGSALILEWRKIYVFGGQALGLVVVNLAFSFVFTASGGGISIGGHIGGLIGGAAATLVFISLRRNPALATLGVAGVGVLSVAVALVSL